MKKIAIFASGSGTNAQNIIEYFAKSNTIKVDSVYSNRKDAFVLERASKMDIPSFLIGRDAFYASDEFPRMLKEREIDLIVLAGFLWLVPENLIREFKIINIHPALLPRYGGKGMYGTKVHQAVIENGDAESGITIHYVNQIYDDGQIIFQAKCRVEKEDTPEVLAARIHKLEYRYYPEIIEKILLD